jgi:hypothetical protein
MCEITEDESLERRLESLAVENERLRGKVALLERDIDVGAGNAELLQLGVEWLRDNPKFTDESFDRLAGENARLAVERDRMRAACEAARDFLEGKVDCGLARQEKGRVLVLIRAALDGDAAPAEGVKTLTVSPEQYELGSAVASGFTARGGPFSRREPYRLVRRLPDGNYLVEDPAASRMADGEGEG